MICNLGPNTRPLPGVLICAVVVPPKDPSPPLSPFVRKTGNRGVNLTDAYLYMTIHPTEVLAEVQGEAELSETGPEIKINIDYTKNSIVGVGDDYKTS